MNKGYTKNISAQKSLFITLFPAKQPILSAILAENV